MVKQIANGVWHLDPDEAGFFLIEGRDGCILLDSGFDAGDIPARLRELVGDKPVQLVNSHYHLDHVKGNSLFPSVYAHPAEFAHIRPYSNTLLPLREGQAFHLGDRTLWVIECPGHSPGSIALLDKENRLLFSGDIIATVPVWMQGDDADLNVYIQTMDKMLALEDQVDQVFGSHGEMPQRISLCRKLKALAQGILDGTIRGQVQDLSGAGGPPYPICLYKLDEVSMFRKAE